MCLLFICSYAYAMLIRTTCYCTGVQDLDLTAVDEGYCAYPCPGAWGQYCGGSTYIEVYYLGD